MKIIGKSQRAKLVGLSLALTCVAVGIIVIQRSSARQQNRNQSVTAEGKRQLHSRIRDGIGLEVQFFSNSSSKDVSDSVDSVESFIQSRSGIKLGREINSKLAVLEQSVLSGTSRRITISQLSEILTDVALHRLATLSDEEIGHVDDTLRGFHTGGMPDMMSARRAIQLQGMGILVSSERFIQEMKQLRTQCSSGHGEVTRAMVQGFVEKNLDASVRTLSEAVPEQFGGIWDSTNNREGLAGVTPLQALVLTYSLASQDLLCDSQDNLKRRMRATRDALTRLTGQTFPNSDGYVPFGPNGYLTSSPLDLVFDDATLGFMLKEMRERSSS